MQRNIFHASQWFRGRILAADNMTDLKKVRVAIIEDERELREGLQALINLTANFSCDKTFGRAETAIRDIDVNSVDIILTDIGLPGMDGIEGMKIFRERFPPMPIVVLTVHNENEKIFQALCAGANGYLLKTSPPAVIIESLTEVLSGGAPMSPEVARRVVELFRKFSPNEVSDYALTEQETSILRLLTEGHHYKTAARELGISVHTVSFHLRNIYAKLQVHSKSEAVAKALRQGLV